MILIRSTAEVPRRMPEATAQAIRAGFERLIGEAQRVATLEAPRNEGQLRGSIFRFMVSDLPNFLGGIETNLPYALVMEHGRAAGGPFPPPDAIARWVWLKRRRFRFRRRTRTGIVEGPIRNMAQARSVAFTVARAIARRGIPSNPAHDSRGFFKKALVAVEALFGGAVAGIEARIERAWTGG